MIDLNIAQRNAVAYSLIPTLRAHRGVKSELSVSELSDGLIEAWMYEALAVVDAVVSEINAPSPELNGWLMGVAV